jgi:hypothetical protein
VQHDRRKPSSGGAAVRRWDSGVTEGAIPVRSKRGFLAIGGMDLERLSFSICFARAMSAKARSIFRRR